MPLYFDQVELISYTHTPLFFGNDFRYAIEKEIVINGVLTNYSNASGISGLINKQELLFSRANDYDNIILNNVSFGSGRISNIETEVSNLVRDSRYTYTLSVRESGNLFNAVSGYYSGINWDANTQLIDSFDESLSYEKDADGVQNYSHNISVVYGKQFPAATGINLGKIFAQNLFNSTVGLFPFLGQYNNLSQYKKLYAETYNLIDRGCGFSAFASILPNNSGGYSYDLNYILTLGEDGYTSVVENCDIVGVFAPRAGWAESGYNKLITGSLNRVNQVFSGYAFSSVPLFGQYISLETTRNKFEGRISFSTEYSNNPIYQTGAIWEFENEVEKGRDGYVNVSERGNVRGYGRALKDKFTNSYKFFTGVVLPGVDSRLSGIYLDFEEFPKSLKTINSSFTKNEIGGEINYSIEKTDNNLYIDVSGMKKMETDISIQYPVHLFQSFDIFNYRQIEQTQNTSTQGTIDIALRLLGKRTSTVDDYLAVCRGVITPYGFYGEDNYLENLTYTINPLSNVFNINATYKFLSGYKLANDILLS